MTSTCKWVVVKLPKEGSNVSKSAWFFDDIEKAILHQQSSPYATVLTYIEEYKPSLLERFIDWFYGSKDSTV